MFKTFTRRHRLDHEKVELQFEYVPIKFRFDIYNELVRKRSENNRPEYYLYRNCSIACGWRYEALYGDEIHQFYTPDVFIDLLQRCEWHEFLTILEHLMHYEWLEYENVNELFAYHSIGYEVEQQHDGTSIIVVKYDKLIEDSKEITDGQIQYAGVIESIKLARKQLLSPENIELCSSIKSSVDAIEAYVIGMLDLPEIKTLGNAIKRLKRDTTYKVRLIEALEKLYAYRNSANNVGHGNPNLEPELTKEDAMLCHEMAISFINYFHGLSKKGN